MNIKKEKIEKADEKIYNEIKIKKWNNLKYNFIKDFGQFPLILYHLFTSILLSGVTTFIIYLSIDTSTVSTLFGHYSLIIFIIICASGLGIIYIFISICFIDWYNKYYEIYYYEINLKEVNKK